MRSSLILFALSSVGGTLAQQTIYGQCGGIGWTGPTTCVSGTTCQYGNDYYSQCLPGGAATTTTKSTTTTTKAATTAPTTTKATTTTTKATTTAAGGTGPACLITAYSQISSAQANCMTITLSNIAAPVSSSINLTALKPSATVIFAGRTTWGITPNSGFRPLSITGTGITVKGAPGAIIDGGGPSYWDGLGNGGNPKPGNMVKIATTNALFSDLYFLNPPTHALDVDGCTGTTFQNIYIDVKAGNAANSISAGKAAAHNTDGFDVANCVNTIFNNVTVYNQDDCVVISDSNNVTVSNSYCNGSHGLSIDGGGSSGTHITENITFKDCTVVGNTTPIRIKTDSGGEGTVENITYENIVVSGVTLAAIDIEQNYGGSAITNGVLVKNITYKNITGSVNSSAKVYNLVCGSGSCQSLTFSGIKITGSSVANTCTNYACPS
ncbi:hypothetical protein TWF694_008515 [Orbilia ellipsospora]|uniref:endo-polygalacturonase n=1 Tax=Orbilia ellipsospora TaxID=2528407 RepID=A0AAV9XN04_9PEZI